VLQARYFDGKTAAAQTVDLELDGRDLLLRGEGFESRWPLAGVRISERLGNTPRLLAFAGQGHCEVSDQQALDRLLAPLAMRRTWLERMQHGLHWALFAALLVALFFYAGYRYFLPWGAEALAMRMPEAVLEKASSATLETLDRFGLKPSKLTADRQQRLRDAYARLKPLPDTRLPYRIVFRSSPEIGANAFALPDGTIVMMDDLVELTRDDDEILAVLAHERGHVERRHAMRLALQSSVVGLVLAWYVGDVSSLLATAPAIIAQAKYSRDMEREADDYAGRTLKLNNLSPCLLASMLRKLEADHRRKYRGAQGGDARGGHELDYLSSHPATPERMARLCPGG